MFNKINGGDEMPNKMAGFWIRLVANFIDSILIAVIGFVLGLVLAITNNEHFLVDYSVDAINFLYLLLLPVLWYGYTLGKKALNIRIVKVDTSNVTLWTMIKRNVISTIVYLLPLFISFFIAILTFGNNLGAILDELTHGTMETPPVSKLDETVVIFSVIILIGILMTFLLFAISAFMVGLREDKRSIHDLIAGTIVIKGSPSSLHKIETDPESTTNTNNDLSLPTLETNNSNEPPTNNDNKS